MRTNIIKCPNCGCEYLPGEIYVGKAFIGAPINVKKDSLGRVTEVIGSDMDTVEYFCCDNCDTPFKIEATVSFETTTLSEQEFKEALSPRITKPQLF